MRDVRVIVHGCDDSTTVTLRDLTPEEEALPVLLAQGTKEAATRGCQPRIEIFTSAEVLAQDHAAALEEQEEREWEALSHRGLLP